MMPPVVPAPTEPVVPVVPVGSVSFVPKQKTTLQQAGLTILMVAAVAAVNAALAIVAQNQALFNPVTAGVIYFVLEFVANWLNPTKSNA